MTQSDATDWLSVDDLLPPLQRLTGVDVQAVDGWSMERFSAGAGEVLGAWRVSGTASAGGNIRPWSIVLKGWPKADQETSSSSWDWPWREAALYQSGVLRDLPGVFAPHCYGSVERNDGIWLWLEDLSPYPQPTWTLEHYAILAQSLGHMNGTWLAGRPLPDHAAFSRRWLEGWMSASNDVMAVFIDHPDRCWPLLPEVASLFLQLWHEREETFRFLASMPQTFCHLDAHVMNAFFRPGDGGEEIVLIDWSFAGLAAPGEELAALVASSALFEPSAFAMVRDIEAIAYRAYLEGLRDAGWVGREEDVWRAYRLSMLLRYGPGTLRNLPPPDPSEEIRRMLELTWGIPFETFCLGVETYTQWLAEISTEGV